MLERAWTSVLGGVRQVVFIGGEPGSGKTRLMAEVALETHRLGAVVLGGWCVADLGLPYQPFDGPAQTLSEALSSGALEPATAAQPRDEVLRHLSVLSGDDAGAGSTPRIDERRARYDAFLGMLRVIAAERPVVLALDDLHRAGETALQLLGYLVERAPDLRLLVLATCRTTVPDRSTALADRMASLYWWEGVHRLDLAPLDTESVIDYLVAEGRVPRDRAASAAVLVRDHTGGNPFFLTEVWRQIAGAGGLAATRISLDRTPQAVSEALEHRIRGLARPQRMTLAVAAVLGEQIRAGEVVPLVRAAESLPALDDLVGAGLLEAVPGQAGVYRFVHALVRQATLDALPSLEQAEHHERIALLLKGRGGDVRRLAHHFAGASLLGHSDEAVKYLTRAAEAADRSLAHAEAARLFEQAASHCTQSTLRETTLLRAARSHQLACAFREALALYEQVSHSTDPDRGLEAIIGLEGTAWFPADTGDHVILRLQAAITAADAGPSHPQHTRAMASLARATAFAGRHDEAETIAAAAIDHARRSDDDEALAVTLWAAVHIGPRPAARDVKRNRAEELSGIATRTGRWAYLGPSAYYRSTLAYQRGDAAALAAAVLDLERTGLAAGQRYWNYLAGCAEAATAFIAGRLDDANHQVEALLQLADTFTGGDAEGLYGVQSFMMRRETGALEPIRPLITGTEPRGGQWLPGLLALYTELGLRDPARSLLRHLVDQILPRENPDSARYPAVLAFLTEAALGLQERDAAATLRPLLAEHTGLNLIMGPFAAVFGAADRYLAQLDSLLDQPDAAGLFEASLDLDTRTGSTLHRAYTLLAWADHARHTADTPLAIRLHAEATTLANQHHLARVLNALRAGHSHPGPAPVGGLSARELEVLRLLARGLSNRQIARTLTISEHTAANHVRNIMTKTGCTNRTQAAMLASTSGLLN